ncbi:MAG: hypothetical protein KKD18_00400 [Nanoarchaeota archaeon]|nr:hypothetical protein [Nanoarchaeota archaeon]
MKISSTHHIARTKYGDVRKRNPPRKTTGKRPRWKSSDGEWVIHRSDGGYNLIIKNLKTGKIEYPATYSDGSVGYVRPHNVPEHIKRQYKKMVNRRTD